MQLRTKRLLLRDFVESETEENSMQLTLFLKRRFTPSVATNRLHGNYRAVLKFGLMVLLLGLAGWPLYRQVHQAQLDDALIAAIKRNDAARVVSLLAQGANPNAREIKEQNGAIWRVLRAMLQGRRPPPAKSRTALWIAMEGLQDDWIRPGAGISTHEAVIKALLDYGANPNIRGEYSRTPLIVAARYQKSHIILLLLQHHADVNAKDETGCNALLRIYTSSYIGPELKSCIRLLESAGAKLSFNQ